MLDLAAMRTIAAVGDTGSLSAAARALGLTQQAVSLRVRAAERQLGLALLVRSPGGSVLTDAGALVAAWSADVLDAADRFEGAVQSLRGAGSIPVRVAASLTIAEHLMPRWLVRHRAEWPDDGAVELTAVNSAAVLAAVRAGTHTIGFVETPDLPTDLEHRQFATDELLVVVRPDHPWAARRRGLTASELAATPLVTRETGSGTRLALVRALEAAGVPSVAQPAAQLPTSAAVRATVTAGSGAAVLSRLAVAEALAAGSLVRVRTVDLTLTRPLSIVWSRATGHLPEPARHLLEIVKG